ncbi:hypothetical protein AVEN_16944-1 [Araneus ventricosus]|uniref:Uncharacterized protein n=1 Tax=Araneus ventricosus TaxID=182803 RepID=A0A4Y2D6M9_ARAVE|nr:hypothetical protein AVEN_16944-1 [Araneus ventricosus]
MNPSEERRRSELQSTLSSRNLFTAQKTRREQATLPLLRNEPAEGATSSLERQRALLLSIKAISRVWYDEVCVWLVLHSLSAVGWIFVNGFEL